MRKFVYIKKSALKSIIQTELLLLVKLILQYPPFGASLSEAVTCAYNKRSF